MVFPVRRFVFDTVDAPVIRVVMDPFLAWRILLYSLFTGKLTLILNPQKLAGRVKGAAGANCHLGPRPARAGVPVTTPPTMPSSVQSATTIPSRRMTTTPLFCWSPDAASAEIILRRQGRVNATPVRGKEWAPWPTRRALLEAASTALVSSALTEQRRS